MISGTGRFQRARETQLQASNGVGGDGSTTSGFFPEGHAYASDGTYVIMATAYYNDGASASASATVSVVPGVQFDGDLLTITAGEEGSVWYHASVGSGTVISGSYTVLYLDFADDLSLSANPNPGYSFLSWTATSGISGAATSPSINIVVRSDSGITANFRAASTLSSSTSVTCSPNPVSVGSSVTCNATVSGSNPTGTVTWDTSSSTGCFSASTCILSSGSCSTTYTDTSGGSVTITATYGGDSNNLPSSDSVTLSVFPSATNSTDILGGNATVDQKTITGVGVDIIGSSAPDGTSLTITSANYGATQPPGTGALQVNGAAFYDVQVNLSAPLGSTAVALVYITNPNFTAQNNNTISYWDTSTNSWVPVATQFIAPETLCGVFFVSDLTGTQITVQMIQPNGGCGGRMPYAD